MFPYNELLWFIRCIILYMYKQIYVSVQRIVMVYRAVTLQLLNNTKFPYNELLWFIAERERAIGILQGSFRTTNCYGLSNSSNNALSIFAWFPYNELLWFILRKMLM